MIDSADLTHGIRISVSVLPMSTAQAAEARKQDERQVATYSVAKVVDGGLGPDSWAIDPAAAAPWITFRTGDRLIRVAAMWGGHGLEELKAVARTITTLPDGIPTAPAVIELPECARGTAAAEHILGTKAVVRRDAVVDGYLFCQWGSATRAVHIRSGASAPMPPRISSTRRTHSTRIA
ncbi:hypothetical protein [Kribbella swartbergensis]